MTKLGNNGSAVEVAKHFANRAFILNQAVFNLDSSISQQTDSL